MFLFKLANLRKAYGYMKKNGIMETVYAALERVQQSRSHYEKREISQAELESQRNSVWDKKEKFSILVPVYKTDKAHFCEMIKSVTAQTYSEWELILADASETEDLKEVAEAFGDKRIRYIRLKENKGISENTNMALEAVTGSYVGLLDHDDFLEPDALYRMMEAVKKAETEGRRLKLLYSDEDKCDDKAQCFYEPHRKMKFNLDLILSNNYICHFLVMDAELMKSLKFRREYDGAQDHDIILRAVAALLNTPRQICHVPYILYHWRCHAGSTAENPKSKEYAYEAGRRAVADFCKRLGWDVQVRHTKHLGFFRVVYKGDVLRQREDLAAVGGRLCVRGKIAGGNYAKDGTVLYGGLPVHFSGYMHRAVLQQDADAVDVRNCRVREELLPVLEAVKREEKDAVKVSIRFGREAEKLGYRLLWEPDYKGMDYL